MITERWLIDKDCPDDIIIEKAANLIKAGELVAFPTETVYGLGADAYNPEAVKRVFAVKGRPPRSALLVHVSRFDQVDYLVDEIPPLAQDLMKHFWPGPLAIILPASSRVPGEVLGGRSTVGIRMPDHQVALALIEKAGPLAAPSANLSGRPSPVTADHVYDDLKGQIAALLDAGSTGIGLESTIIDLSQAKPIVARLGSVPLEILQQHLKSLPDVSPQIKPVYKTGQTTITLCDDMPRWEQILAEGPLGDTALIYYEEQPQPGIKSEWPVYRLNLTGSNTELFNIIRDAEKKGFVRLVFAPLPSGLTGLAGSLAARIKQAAGLI